MVDFNAETTVGVPLYNIVSILLLEHNQYCHEALEDYRKKKELGVNISLNIIKARFQTLWLKTAPYIKKRYPEDYEKKRLIVFDNKTRFEEYITLSEWYQEVLNDLEIIKVDLKKRFDRTNIENENKVYGI